MQYLTSPSLTDAGFRHAFFTRDGGTSTGAYASLNFSYGVGDEPACVDENFRRAEAGLGLGDGRLLFLSQVHGSGVVRVDGSATRKTTATVEGDALVSGFANLGLGVRSADCIPILLGDGASGQAAAIHAGWRGLVRGVIGATLRAFPGDKHSLFAAVGPHIGAGAFEVGEDVLRELLNCSTAKEIAVRGLGSRPHVDLRRIATAQLVTGGIHPAQVDQVLGCTMSEPERFFSFRRDGQRSGRHLSVIVPKAASALSDA